MTSTEVEWILSRHGQEATTYTYFRDKYALLLAAWATGEGQRVTDFKRGRLAGLLQKDILKQHCARHAVLREADLLAHAAPGEGWTLRRTLSYWGEAGCWWGAQTSREGYNLVLRLDFGHQQDRMAARLRVADVLEELDGRNHMHLAESYNVAWCRLDMDWETGEVLIEEIQNDWLRDALRFKTAEWRYYDCLPWYCLPRKADLRNDARFLEYCRTVIEPLEKVWSEAIVCAALEFIRNELGLRTVYMHTADCGARLKGMSDQYMLPPRSLYQEVPRRLCFEPTGEVPAFLSRSWSHAVIEDANYADFRKRFARPFSFWKMEL
jgi:hypothetical protein